MIKYIDHVQHNKETSLPVVVLYKIGIKGNKL